MAIWTRQGRGEWEDFPMYLVSMLMIDRVLSTVSLENNANNDQVGLRLCRSIVCAVDLYGSIIL
jgi:hypothetical protein